jgi:LysM repeat protein
MQDMRAEQPRHLRPEEPRHLRQFGTAILTTLVSITLVIGGLSLALAEGRPTTSFATVTSSISPIPTLTDTLPAVLASETATQFLVIGTPTNAILSNQTPIQTISTLAGSVTTPIACGSPYGWVKTYVVQPGDTLYRIALNYYTTTADLQRANCKGTSTTIHSGEYLWTPNVAPRTPGVTTIPEFKTSTPIPTDPLTETPLPFTASPEPSQTPATPPSSP